MVQYFVKDMYGVEKINYHTLKSNRNCWDTATILFHGDHVNDISKKLQFLLEKKTDHEIKETFKQLEEIKILQQVETSESYHKFILSDEKERKLGFVYLGDSTSSIYKIRKIKYNLDYLACTWRIDHFPLLLRCILNFISKDLEILIIVFGQEISNLNPDQSLIGIHVYEEKFFIKPLSGEDVVMFYDKLIIINPEKVLFKDLENKDVKQKLQFYYNKDGNIETNDKSSEEVNKKIEELERRQILNII